MCPRLQTLTCVGSDPTSIAAIGATLILRCNDIPIHTLPACCSLPHVLIRSALCLQRKVASGPGRICCASALTAVVPNAKRLLSRGPPGLSRVCTRQRRRNGCAAKDAEHSARCHEPWRDSRPRSMLTSPPQIRRQPPPTQRPACLLHHAAALLSPPAVRTAALPSSRSPTCWHQQPSSTLPAMRGSPPRSSPLLETLRTSRSGTRRRRRWVRRRRPCRQGTDRWPSWERGCSSRRS